MGACPPPPQLSLLPSFRGGFAATPDSDVCGSGHSHIRGERESGWVNAYNSNDVNGNDVGKTMPQPHALAHQHVWRLSGKSMERKIKNAEQN